LDKAFKTFLQNLTGKNLLTFMRYLKLWNYSN